MTKNSASKRTPFEDIASMALNTAVESFFDDETKEIESSIENITARTILDGVRQACKNRKTSFYIPITQKTIPTESPAFLELRKSLLKHNAIKSVRLMLDTREEDGCLFENNKYYENWRGGIHSYGIHVELKDMRRLLKETSQKAIAQEENTQPSLITRMAKYVANKIFGPQRETQHLNFISPETVRSEKLIVEFQQNAKTLIERAEALKLDIVAGDLLHAASSAVDATRLSPTNKMPLVRTNILLKSASDNFSRHADLKTNDADIKAELAEIFSGCVRNTEKAATEIRRSAKFGADIETAVLVDMLKPPSQAT